MEPTPSHEFWKVPEAQEKKLPTKRAIIPGQEEKTTEIASESLARISCRDCGDIKKISLPKAIEIKEMEAKGD